jgi:hypothetical protein
MTRQIVPLIVVHGLPMSAWVSTFFVQSTPIVIGNRWLHMMIGPVGAVLAAVIVILGITAILSFGTLGGNRDTVPSSSRDPSTDDAAGHAGTDARLC